MNENNKSLLTGVGIGIIFPLICLFVFYSIRIHGIIIHLLPEGKRLFILFLSLSGIPNLVLFYLYLNREKYQLARGIILATFLLVIVVVILKLAK